MLSDKLKVDRLMKPLTILVRSFEKTLDDIHTIDNLAHAHIAQCSAENIMLWGQFIQTFGLHDSVAIVIAKEYHLKRVRKTTSLVLYSSTLSK
jgi:hypothetical protein